MMFNIFKRKRKTAITDDTELIALIERFVTEVETGQTSDWCKCLWRIHPDDQGTKIGHCVNCGVARIKHTATHHTYLGVRRVRVDDHPFCPMHTKEGLLLRFLEWMDVTR